MISFCDLANPGFGIYHVHGFGMSCLGCVLDKYIVFTLVEFGLTNVVSTLGRLALLCFITIAVTGTFIVEQPRSSLLLDHPRMQQLVDVVEAEYVRISHAPFKPKALSTLKMVVDCLKLRVTYFPIKYPKIKDNLSFNKVP